MQLTCHTDELPAGKWHWNGILYTAQCWHVVGLMPRGHRVCQVQHRHFQLLISVSLPGRTQSFRLLLWLVLVASHWQNLFMLAGNRGWPVTCRLHAKHWDTLSRQTAFVLRGPLLSSTFLCQQFSSPAPSPESPSFLGLRVLLIALSWQITNPELLLTCGCPLSRGHKRGCSILETF